MKSTHFSLITKTGKGGKRIVLLDLSIHVGRASFKKSARMLLQWLLSLFYRNLYRTAQFVLVAHGDFGRTGLHAFDGDFAVFHAYRRHLRVF